MELPEFKKGEVLRAEQLQMLANRVRELQRAAGRLGNGGVQVRRRVRPARRYGFQLAERAGCVLVRVGWVHLGNGVLQRVGDEEWTVLAGLGPMTIWLEIGREGSRVTVGEYDEVTPEGNLRRRLGYVRQDDGGVLHMVQLAGGLVHVCAPRRQMGVSEMAAGAEVGKADMAFDWLRAGNVRGKGFAEVPGRHYAGRSVGLAYTVSVMPVTLPTAHGGNRMMQVMSLGAGV